MGWDRRRREGGAGVETDTQYSYDARALAVASIRTYTQYITIHMKDNVWNYSTHGKERRGEGKNGSEPDQHRQPPDL